MSIHPTLFLGGVLLRQVRLAELEKGLLGALATAQGDLLEDTSLMERLTETKATAAEIQVAAGRRARDIRRSRGEPRSTVDLW